MSAFEYLTVFLSVIYGLAVVHLLGGVSLILDARERSEPYWVHLLWTCNVFVLTMAVWWFRFPLNQVVEWTFSHFVVQVVHSVLTYLLAGLLFPVRGPEVVDFRGHFERNRRWFFLVFALIVAVDVVDSFEDARVGLAEHFSVEYYAIAAASIGGFLVASKTRREIYLGGLGVAWLTVMISWIALRYAILPGTV